MSLRILITNNTLAGRAGTELYVRDIALALLNRGYHPIAYSSLLGEVAQELRAATVPVIDRLDALAVPPDLIHGHHHLETMTALLHFPRVPAISFATAGYPGRKCHRSFRASCVTLPSTRPAETGLFLNTPSPRSAPACC